MTADAAAALLGTSPTILNLWAERYGYPVPERSADGQALYSDEMMIALRDALGIELSVASAIARVRGADAIDSVICGRGSSRGAMRGASEISEEAG